LNPRPPKADGVYEQNKVVMKNAFIIFFPFIMSLVGNGHVQAASIPSHPVEVIIDGKKYASIHVYKLQRLKEGLKHVLSAGQIQEFSEEELCAAMKELKQSDGGSVKTPDTQENEISPSSLEETQNLKVPSVGSEEDSDTAQMKEMLQDYLTEHEDVSPVVFDPQKVKTVIIRPPAETSP